MIVSRSVLLRMKNVHTNFVEKINTHFTFDYIFFYNSAVYKKMLKNSAVPGSTGDNTVHAHYMLYT